MENRFFCYISPLKKMLFVLADIICITFSMLAAIWVRFGAFEGMSVPTGLVQNLILFIPFLLPFGLLTFWSLGLYNRTLRFTSLFDAFAVVIAVSVFSAIKVACSSFIPRFEAVKDILIVDWMQLVMLVGALRIAPRALISIVEVSPLRGWLFSKTTTKTKRVMVIGAGQGGESIVREIKRNMNLPIEVIGFIDDASDKQGQIIHGVKVVGTTEKIDELCKAYEVDEFIIAIPSASGNELRRIVKLCQHTNVRFKTLPGLQDLIAGKLVSLQLRDIVIEDLLRRTSSEINLAEIAAYVTGKTLLVTGAGGSIGSEICRQILPFQPEKLLLMGHGENSIYTVHQELLKHPELGNTALIPIITDIQDKEKIDHVFNGFKPNIVFHAAAHKHVPMMELNPEESVKNNVIGTYNVAEAAHKYKVERFVMISTDKAVNPTSVMGASKRTAEKIVKSFAKRSSTRFVAVRFGNVLGSRGSVIPMFKSQIEQGGPITITHPNMIRYFMTIPEASKLVIQAGAYGKGGEVFILDMGDPVKILDLAEDLVRLAGLEVGKDIEIKFTGIRPGEKLYEELLTSSEGIAATKNKKIFIAKPEEVNEEELMAQVAKLHTAAIKANPREVIEQYKIIVPTFMPNRDMIYSEKRKQTVNNEPILNSTKLRVVN